MKISEMLDHVKKHVEWQLHENQKAYEELYDDNQKFEEDLKVLFEENSNYNKVIGKAIKYVTEIDDFDIKDFRRQDILKILKGKK